MCASTLFLFTKQKKQKKNKLFKLVNCQVRTNCNTGTLELTEAN